MKDKPILDSVDVPSENNSPIDGTYPEQQPKKFATFRELIESFGLKPKNLALYGMAFTHASYYNENRGSPDYDRLEFLGDAVLDMVVGDLVYRNHPDWRSGKLSRARAQIVEGKCLSELAINMGFAPYVRFSVGEKKNAAYHNHIFEDVFESFIGCVYLENGFDFVYRFLSKLLYPYISGGEQAGAIDWKTKLQEEIQSEFRSPLTYQVVSESGIAQDKTFTVACLVDGVVLGTGVGHNKKQAETEAAKEALLARKRG